MSARLFGQRLQTLLPAARAGVAVLAYHLVEGGTRSPVDIPLSVFREQLAVLADHEVISLSTLLQRMRQDVTTPAVVLTFDDAYLNFLDVAWPELERRRLPCTLYAPTSFIAGKARPPIRGTSLQACSWDQLRQLAGSGVEIGSHGVDHLNLRGLDAAALERELGESRRLLETELGVPVDSFCYPQAKFDARAVAAVRRHYASAVKAGGVRARPASDPHLIPRFPIRRDETEFARLLKSEIWLSEAVSSRLRQLRP